MKLSLNRIKGKIIGIKQKIGNKIYYFVDYYYDMRICGQSLSKYIPSVFRDDKNGIGMTGSQSTHYWIIKRIMSNVRISKEDSFVDVGCGMGRVLAFCIKEKYPCSINGIEINEISGKKALDWSARYEQINVTVGDAFTFDFSPYTIVFFGRPFLPKTFLKFLDYFEPQITHPITFIYWWDQQSGFYLNGRKGWTMKKTEKIWKIHGIRIPDCPQEYSIWEYKP